MSRMKELKERLEAAGQAVDALDAALAGGAITADEHARRRADREREVGRLFVELRHARRDARERPGAPAPAVDPRPGWTRNPLVMIPGAALLVLIGVGGGIAGARWLGGARGTPAAVATTVPAPDNVSTLMNQVDQEALRQAAERPDAPIDGLLRLAHQELDQGRLSEARALYQRVLAREPRNAEAVDHLGAVLFKEGRIDEALGKVEEALRLDPRYVHAHWDRVQYLFHAKQDFPGTVRAAEAFLKVVPDGPDADSVRKIMAEARRASPAGTPATTTR